MGADIVTLDPAGQQDTTTAVVIKHAYSTLLDISDEGELVPDLAESYELVNDTDFVFKLREDAVWSDGTPVTANDVKFTFDRAKNMPKTKSNTSKVKEVVVDNEHQVTIKLTEPYAPFNTIVGVFEREFEFWLLNIREILRNYVNKITLFPYAKWSLHCKGMGSQRPLYTGEKRQLLG